MNKATGGREGWRALGAHGFHVGLCLVPAVLAFGLPGLVYLVAGRRDSHMIVDRWKVQATRRAEAEAQAQARARIEQTGQAPPSGLGAAWTPWPGILFLADQALHLTFAIVGWLVILAGAALLPQFVDFVNRIFGDWDRTTVNAVILTTLVIMSLFIVNTRAAYYFVLALVSPRELAPDARRRAASPRPPGPPPCPGTPCGSGPWWRRSSRRPSSDRGDPTTGMPMIDGCRGRSRRTRPRRPRRRAPVAAVPERGARQDRCDHRRARAAADRRVHAHRRRGGRGVRDRREDDRAVQAARRPRLRRVLPARHARERRGRGGQRAGRRWPRSLA